MNKKGSKRNIILVIMGFLLIIALIIGMFLYFSLKGPNYEKVYEEKIASGALTNPADGLSQSEIIAQFDERFVKYILYTIKAYNLHSPPMSTDVPKILLHIGDDPFNAQIVNGEIQVSRGEITNEDIIITTSKEVAATMMGNKQAILDSFSDGKSTIEMKADKTTLFSKGYLSLYTEVTGKSITGGVIGVYSH